MTGFGPFSEKCSFFEVLKDLIPFFDQFWPSRDPSPPHPPLYYLVGRNQGTLFWGDNTVGGGAYGENSADGMVQSAFTEAFEPACCHTVTYSCGGRFVDPLPCYLGG